MSSDAAAAMDGRVERLLEVVQRALAGETPTRRVAFLVPLYSDGDTGLPIPLPVPPLRAEFEPSDFQMSILRVLEGRAMRVIPLGEAVGDGRKLYRQPGGIFELRDHGLVAYTKQHGYYRPDAPPPELAVNEDDPLEPASEHDTAVEPV